MKKLIRIIATPFLLLTLLSASACSSNEGGTATSRIPNGEVITIKSAAPERDFSLHVVADRDDYNQKDMEFYVSAESPAELHELVQSNIGKKIRIAWADGLISAAEELDGEQRFAGAISPSSEAESATNEGASNENNTNTTRSSSAVVIGSTRLDGLIVDGAEFIIDDDANYENQLDKYADKQYAKSKWENYTSKLGKPLCDGAICLSIGDYQYLCEKADGVTKSSIAGITALDSVTAYLIENGKFEGADFEWETYPTTKGERAGRCIVKVTASGIYQGSSRRSSAQAQVRRFAVIDGEIIAAYAYPRYTDFILRE